MDDSADMRTGFVDVARATVRYTLQGETGPWVVLLHEMGGAIESWSRVAPVLARRRRVLCYDTRGAGMSEKLVQDVRIEELTDDLLALLDVLEITEPVGLVGCAVGGAIALSFAARHPERAAAVAVLDPAIDLRPEAKPGVLARAERLRIEGMRSIEEASLIGGYPPLLRQRDPQRFAEFRARWLGNDPQSLAYLFRMLAQTDLWPVLASIRCPALGLAGVHDALRPPEYVRRVLDRIPDHRVIEVDAGHHMADQAPELICEHVGAFLDEVQPVDRTGEGRLS